MKLTKTLEEYKLVGDPLLLPGGSREAFRVGNVVLKQVKERSLENNHSPKLAGWIAEFSSTLPQNGFRIPKGVPTKDGKWITEEGWTAWTFVEGSHATKQDIPQCIEAINALNHSLKEIPKNLLMDDNQTAWVFGQIQSQSHWHPYSPTPSASLGARQLTWPFFRGFYETQPIY